jgi:hypothetical protein
MDPANRTRRPRRFKLLCLLAALPLAWSGVPLPVLSQRLLAADDAAAVAARLREEVGFLSSDALEGRGADTAGIQKAAEYLAAKFQEIGLNTQLFENQPYQKFAVSLGAEMGPKESNRLVLAGPPAADGKSNVVELKLGEQFTPLALGGTGKIEAPLVFVGYGISAPESQYDDYTGLDVKGKVVVILRKEPQQENPQSTFSGKQASKHSQFSAKVANAVSHGAAAVIFVNDALTLTQASAAAKRQWNETLDQVKSLREKFSTIGDPSAQQFAEHRAEILKTIKQLESLDAKLAGDFDDLLPFERGGVEADNATLPVLFVKRSAIDNLFQQAAGISLAALESKIDEGPAPHSQLLNGWTATCQSDVVHRKADVKNVVGVLEGVGNLAGETVVVGAHYDHIGLGGGSSRSPDKREVHNGADDNASGTAMVIEIARALAAEKSDKPRRRIVFTEFAGEERGLLGSQEYVKHAPFALDQTVAMVNLDMVGRLANNKLEVYGTGTAKEFDPLVEQLNQKYGFELKKEPGGMGPSDHSSFYGRKVPVLFFFTGVHDDYHRPSDDAEKINFDGMARISQMVTDAVRAVATAEKRPEYVSVAGGGVQRGRGDRPRLGIVPDFSQQGNGCALSGVAKDSPAERAGLTAGDVIVQVSDIKVNNLEDLQNAMVKQRPGEKVQIKVRRGTSELELSVVFDPPK